MYTVPLVPTPQLTGCHLQTPQVEFHVEEAVV